MEIITSFSNSISRCFEFFMAKHDAFNNIDFKESKSLLNNNSMMKTINLKIELIIKKFNSLSHLIYQNDDQYFRFSSERVSHANLPNVEWELCFKIKKGSGYSGLSYFSSSQTIIIWLRQISATKLNDLVNTRYKIYSIKKNSHRVDIVRSTNKLESRDKLGITEIELLKIYDAYDDLRLYCEIEADCYNSTDNLMKTYHNMLEKGTFSDFIIKVGNKSIKAHRSVLAQNSAIFKKMLEQEEFIEAQKGEVTISEYSTECVQVMLEFFYTRETANLAKHVHEVFTLAHMYEVEPLIYECECIMSSNISVQNLKKYCGIICMYGASTLEKACINFIRNNNKSFLNSKEWEDLKETFPQLTYRLLENVIDDLN